MSGVLDITTPVTVAESPDELHIAAHLGYWTRGERYPQRDSLNDRGPEYVRFALSESDITDARGTATLDMDGEIRLKTYQMSRESREYFRMQGHGP